MKITCFLLTDNASSTESGWILNNLNRRIDHKGLTAKLHKDSICTFRKKRSHFKTPFWVVSFFIWQIYGRRMLISVEKQKYINVRKLSTNSNLRPVKQCTLLTWIITNVVIKHYSLIFSGNHCRVWRWNISWTTNPVEETVLTDTVV